MLRKFSAGLLVLAFAAVVPRPAAAQGFGEGYLDIGPTLGLGGLGSASTAFGARIEKAIKPLESLGGGMLGIQVGLTYYTWSSSFYSYKYIPIGATANYHFKVSDEKIDPFVGLGLGYQVVSCDWKGFGADLCDDSAIYFVGRAGIRYFMSEKMALYGDVGAGGATLNVGLMFKLK